VYRWAYCVAFWQYVAPDTVAASGDRRALSPRSGSDEEQELNFSQDFPMPSAAPLLMPPPASGAAAAKAMSQNRRSIAEESPRKRLRREGEATITARGPAAAAAETQGDAEEEVESPFGIDRRVQSLVSAARMRRNNEQQLLLSMHGAD
jgi:hypothetical protein